VKVKINLKVTVESADLRDIEQLLRIERECFTGEAFTKEEIFLLLTNPNAISLVAKVNSEIAGFIIGVVENHGAVKAGHVFTIDVAIKHRRKGLGMKLLGEMEKTFLNGGAETSYLEVRVDNEAAMRLYKKQGYRETKSLGNYYSTGVHGFRLVKRLTI
jgi:ribosomal-protein-alanine N-acetyltransferase